MKLNQVILISPLSDLIPVSLLYIVIISEKHFFPLICLQKSEIYKDSFPPYTFLKAIKLILSSYIQFSSVQLLSRVRLFATPWIAARQASLSITNSRSSLKLTSIESVMLSSHLILCCPLLLPPIPPSIRVFSNESTLCMRWPKYWSFSFIIPSKEIPGLISFRMDPSLHGKYMGKQWKQWQTLFSWAPMSLWMVTATTKLEEACS